MRLTWKSLWLVFFLTSPALAAQKPNPFLAQAKVFYEGLDFEKCLKRLAQASRWKNSTRAEQVDIELYTGLCAFNLGDEAEARRSFSVALELDPKVALPPYTSPRLVAFFEGIAQREPREAPPPSSPAPAPAPVVQDPPRKVDLAPPPPPEQPVFTQTAPEPKPKKLLLPVILSGTSVAAAGGAVYFGLQARAEEKRANDRDTFYEDALASQKEAQQNARLTNAAIGVAATAAVGAVLAYVLQ